MEISVTANTGRAWPGGIIYCRMSGSSQVRKLGTNVELVKGLAAKLGSHTDLQLNKGKGLVLRGGYRFILETRFPLSRREAELSCLPDSKY